VSDLKEIIPTMYFRDSDGDYHKCHKLLPDIRRIFGEIEYIDGEPVEIIPEKKRVRKPFSKSNHNANDGAGKKVVIDFLRSRGIDAMENPDDYGIDLMVAKYEVERRTIYTDKWPYKTVHVPERKEKFFKYNIYYVVVMHHETKTKTFDTLLFCETDVIKKYPLVEVPNKSVSKGEYFYDVPLSEWKEFNV